MQLSFRIDKTADFIFDYLTDMQKFVSVHPVITKIDRIENEHYLVHETLKLGFIPFSFTYPVSIESQKQTNSIIMRATVMKLVKIEMRFVLKEEKGHTLVEENIQFQSLLPVGIFMQRIFQKQHTALFQNIQAVNK